MKLTFDRRAALWILSVPPLLWLGLFFVAPLVLMAVFSFSPTSSVDLLHAWAPSLNQYAQAGSDASSMKTTATRRDGGWILNGSKNFITNATFAETTVALAISDRAAGSHGISAFIIERGTKGFSVAKKENKLGMRASDTAALE